MRLSRVLKVGVTWEQGSWINVWPLCSCQIREVRVALALEFPTSSGYAATRYHRLHLFFISHDSISLESYFYRVLIYSHHRYCELGVSDTNRYYGASLSGSEKEPGGLLYSLSWIEGSVLLKEVSILDILSSKTVVKDISLPVPDTDVSGRLQAQSFVLAYSLLSSPFETIKL